MMIYTVRGISVVFICNGETSKEFYYVNNARGISTSETVLLQYRASVQYLTIMTRSFAPMRI